AEKVLALDRVLRAHEREHRVRVLDDADPGAAIERLERVVVPVDRIVGADGIVGQGGRHECFSRLADADVRFRRYYPPQACPMPGPVSCAPPGPRPVETACCSTSTRTRSGWGCWCCACRSASR